MLTALPLLDVGRECLTAEARCQTDRMASIYLHLDTLILLSIFSPAPALVENKTYKQVQTADCMILGILCFYFLLP